MSATPSEKSQTEAYDEPQPRVRPRAPLPVAAVVAAGWAAISSYGGLLFLGLLAALGSGAGLGGVARLTAGAWFLAQAVPVRVSGDRLSLMPLAVTAFVLWRLVRAGVHASRAVGAHRHRSLGRAGLAAVAVAVVYALVGTAVAFVASGDELDVSPLRAGATLGGFAAIVAGAGAVGHSRAGRALLVRSPLILREGARVGLAAAALTLAAGAAAGGAALALHGSEAATMLSSFRAGVLGQAGITLLCLVYLPNAAIWGADYLLGPGFAVGSGTVVSPGLVLLGPVPGVPLFAGLPDNPLTGVGPALLGVPLLAGAAAGWLVARRGLVTGAARLGVAGLGGLACGLVLQLATMLASGALGSGRLTVVGSTDWRIGGFAALVVAIGATAGTLVSRPRIGQL